MAKSYNRNRQNRTIRLNHASAMRKAERLGMFVPRGEQAKLLELSRQYPAVSVTGPRQSGKTTLVCAAFPGYDYISFENPDTLNLFAVDPRTFLRQHGEKVIFDEAQRAPELFSYLQQIIDTGRNPGRFILTGS